MFDRDREDGKESFVSFFLSCMRDPIHPGGPLDRINVLMSI